MTDIMNLKLTKDLVNLEARYEGIQITNTETCDDFAEFLREYGFKIPHAPDVPFVMVGDVKIEYSTGYGDNTAMISFSVAVPGSFPKSLDLQAQNPDLQNKLRFARLVQGFQARHDEYQKFAAQGYDLKHAIYPVDIYYTPRPGSDSSTGQEIADYLYRNGYRVAGYSESVSEYPAAETGLEASYTVIMQRKDD